MAESQIAGLFMTPEMYQRQQMQADRQRAAEYAQLAPEQRAAMGFFSAGQGLGRVAGTLLGAQDPQLQRITEQQQMLQGLDVADPNSLMEAARRASQAGNVPLAMQLASRAQEVAQGLATTRKAELSLAQEQQLRAELANLPADATDEQRIAILSKYGPPGQMLQALTTRVERQADREARAEESRQRIEARRQDLELQLENRLQVAAAQGATQQQIAQMQIDGRRQIAEMMAAVRREIAAGRAPNGGRQDRQSVAQERVERGREQLTSEIDSLLGEYKKLNDLGAMVDPKRSAGQNISARTRASVPGQLVGSFVGSPEQTLRDNITNARARLTNAIKEATGMSAQQMNSNVELQLWLKSVTDPTQSYSTVVKTLGDLDTIIGRNMREPGAGAGASGSWNQPAGTGNAPAPKPTKRWNPTTRRLEDVTGN